MLGDEQPITVRPADLVDETLEDYRDEIGDLARSEEDVLSYALFPADGAHLPRAPSHRPREPTCSARRCRPTSASQIGAALGASAADRVRDILSMVEDERRRRGRDRGGRPQGDGAQGRPPRAAAPPRRAGGAVAGAAARGRRRPTATTSCAPNGSRTFYRRRRRSRRPSSRSATPWRPGRRSASSR